MASEYRIVPCGGKFWSFWWITSGLPNFTIQILTMSCDINRKIWSVDLDVFQSCRFWFARSKWPIIMKNAFFSNTTSWMKVNSSSLRVRAFSDRCTLVIPTYMQSKSWLGAELLCYFTISIVTHWNNYIS